jgi:hypothetical protein
MKYFSNFPKTLFLLKPAAYQVPAEYISLTDITRNVRFKKEVLDNIVLYDTYNIKEGDTPEIVSEKLYGTPYYQWVLMLLNDRYDYVMDFPMSQESINDYIKEKFNEDYLEETYGVDANGLIVDIVSGKTSTDINGVYNLVNKQDDTVIQKPIMSAYKWDETLQENVKVFLYTDEPVNNSYSVDMTQWRVDFGAIPDVIPVYAANKIIEDNFEKSKIKVISEELLQSVLSNFRDLM